MIEKRTYDRKEDRKDRGWGKDERKESLVLLNYHLPKYYLDPLPTDT
jgi:hypothetical protein